MLRALRLTLAISTLAAAALAACSSDSTPSSSNGGGAGLSGGGTSDSSAYTLTPLTFAQTNTAQMSLFFSVTDAQGKGVAGLEDKTGQPQRFSAQEDGKNVDPLESNFTVVSPSGQTLDVPTVLVLDLSNSIVASGSLADLKKAALAFIDGLIPEQRVAILTFADKVTLRSDFTSDAGQLKSTIEAIQDGDGVSTNLHGALAQALGMWTDGFTGAGPDAKLTAGLAVVLTDGADTAGVVSLADLIQARVNKRVIAVGVGDAVDGEELTAIGNAGYVISSSYGELTQQMAEVTATMQSISKSIYQATYCSPKLAGDHELTFTVVGNPSDENTRCVPATFSTPHCQSNSDHPTYTQTCTQTGNDYLCCPADEPFFCAAANGCFRTAEGAALACEQYGAECTACGGSGNPNAPDAQMIPGYAIHVRFSANGHSTDQCSAFSGSK